MARSRTLKVLLEPEELGAIQDAARVELRTASSWARAVLVEAATQALRKDVEQVLAQTAAGGQVIDAGEVADFFSERWGPPKGGHA